MDCRIKIDLQKQLQSGPVALDLGCGSRKKEGSIGIDAVDLPGVDVVADIEKGLPFLPDNCAMLVHCRSVLEHVNDFEFVMREIVRVLKPAGRAEIFVPHFSNPYGHSDFTHRRVFGLYSFYYFARPEHQPARRKVPHYYTDVRVRVVSRRLVFRSAFGVEKPFRKLFGWIVNLCALFQEYYEENLCYMVPCHGIEVVLAPEK